MKVLIVDDDAIVRRALARAFKGVGAVVEQAADGQEGVEKWNKFEPDLVLLDVIMPRMTGYELLTRHDNLPQARVVLMSAFSGEHPDEEAALKKSDLFIKKPFENIFDVVKEATSLVESGGK